MKSKLHPKTIVDTLQSLGSSYFCGVPDSVTGPLCSYAENSKTVIHDIAANEGNAIGMAIGYYISSSHIPVVYMQNSGLNNALDPLTSLSDESIFKIPLFLLIGWRGEPGTHDEPQHVKQGPITMPLLTLLDIPYKIASHNPTTARKQIEELYKKAQITHQPVALIIRNHQLSGVDQNTQSDRSLPTREAAINEIISNLPLSSLIVASNGKSGRELFELRDQKQQKHSTDLLVVGGMGHASSVALGVSRSQHSRVICCLDGDGAAIMHLGAMTKIGNSKPDNFIHVIFHNSCHDSVGGHPTAAPSVSFAELAQTCGYRNAYSVNTLKEIEESIKKSLKSHGPTLLEIYVASGSRKDLGRPSTHPTNNAIEFGKTTREMV